MSPTIITKKVYSGVVCRYYYYHYYDMDLMQCNHVKPCGGGGREMCDYRLKITVNCLCVFDGRLLN